MIAVGKQLPMYYENASHIETIKIGVSQQQFNTKITQIVREVDDICEMKYPNSNLIDMLLLAQAAKKVGELSTLDSKNKEIPRLQNAIDNATRAYFEPTINWINKNWDYFSRGINQIDAALYDQKLYNLVKNLSYNELLKLGPIELEMLVLLSDEVARNTEFTSEHDPRLRIFQLRLRNITKFITR